MQHPFYALGKFSRRVGLGRALLALVFVAVALFALPALDPLTVAGLLVLAVVVAGVNSAVEIVDATEKRALTVFGEYRGLLEPGLHFVPPFVSRTHTFDMRTRTLDVPRQEAITRDNSPVSANAVLYVRVMDAERAYLDVDDYERAVAFLGQTTLRAVLGDMKLDETLSRRDRINARIREEIDEPTDGWGVRVEAVEVQEVMPSGGVVAAMERQTSAERKRRAMILEAQGERRSAVERAEGKKRANVIRAQGEKQSRVLEAQGGAVSTVLGARAAESMGERAVVDRGMETLSAVGEGEATTFVLPQELSSMLGRYGRHLTGSDVATDGPTLDAQEFDPETEALLGLDDVEAMLSGSEASATEFEDDAARWEKEEDDDRELEPVEEQE
ncbi:SPFH domain-containing protein [Halomicrococcus gelatinilyticus]|uniref:SPFH domain-containing protein n=1 Tax=Halomicrococcus gelatinilyticus TaxID=1702103 RepID=UPI002E15BAB7